MLLLDTGNKTEGKNVKFPCLFRKVETESSNKAGEIPC